MADDQGDLEALRDHSAGYGTPGLVIDQPGSIAQLALATAVRRAVDDAGDEHEGIPGGWRGTPTLEGRGSFWFWPPVDPARKSLQMTVSTLWEAAWAEIELPHASPAPK